MFRARRRGWGGLAFRTHGLVPVDQVLVVDEGFTVFASAFGEGTTAARAVRVKGVDALLDLCVEGATEVRYTGNGPLDGDLGGDNPHVGVLRGGGGTGRVLGGHVQVSHEESRPAPRLWSL